MFFGRDGQRFVGKVQFDIGSIKEGGGIERSRCSYYGRYVKVNVWMYYIINKFFNDRGQYLVYGKFIYSLVDMVNVMFCFVQVQWLILGLVMGEFLIGDLKLLLLIEVRSNFIK